MFDSVPAQVWLLIAIAAIAYAPAHYVYRYIAFSPSRRDITRPSEDFSWRTASQFARNLSALAALVALAAFIFTPAAAQFARSPRFLPILMTGCGAWALFTVPRGIATGQIQPFMRGINNTYEREAQPKRFWASLTWNAVFGGICFWLAFAMNEDATAQPVLDRCKNQRDTYPPREMLSACNQLIGKETPLGYMSLADALLYRGIAYSRLGDYEHAIADDTEVLRLQSDYSAAHYNRGLAYGRLGDSGRAIADYSAVIRLQPNDADAYFNRGLIFLDARKLDEAVADFTRAHELQPKDPWPLANRGVAYALKRNPAQAEEDFNTVRAIDPANPVLLRGEALLSIIAGDMTAAVDRLTAALNREPEDEWSLRMRAYAYGQLGEYEKSQADSNKLLQLSKVANVERHGSH